MNIIKRLPDRLSALSVWQIDAIGVGVCLLLAGVWYLFGVLPVYQASASRDVLDGRRQARDAALHGLLESHVHRERIVDKLNKDIEAASVQLLAVDRVNARIAELESLASRHDLRIDEVHPGAPVSLTRYITVPIQIAGTGSYAECSRFLHALRGELHDMGVAGFDLHGEPEAPDKPSAFTLSLLWYAAPSAPAVLPAQTARK